jgi:hypothetical protein
LFSQLSAGDWLAIGMIAWTNFLNSACTTLYVIFIFAENHEHKKNMRRIFGQINDHFTFIVLVALITGPKIRNKLANGGL